MTVLLRDSHWGFPGGLLQLDSFLIWWNFSQRTLSVDVLHFCRVCRRWGRSGFAEGAKGVEAVLLLKGQSNKFACNKFTLNLCLLKGF